MPSSAVGVFVRRVSKKLMKLGLSIFPTSFSSSKCKTWVKMATARIKLLRNKREAVVKQMRRDVALLIQSGQDATARIRVEHVIREQNSMAANEIIELFCDQILTRLTIIAKQRDCPADLKEAIGSLIFAAPRCSDIPELLSIRDIFEKKYGKDFVSGATDLRPDSGVNRLLIEKLSSRNPSGELKLKVLKEIAKEYRIDWDTKESEMELLKPAEERIEGPRTFVSSASFPLKPPSPRPSGGAEAAENNMYFEDAASAAKAAAESANQAVAAAQAAAQIAGTKSYITILGNNSSVSSISLEPRCVSNPYKIAPGVADDVGRGRRGNRFHESRSSGGSLHCTSYDDESENVVSCRKIHRRYSYNVPSACSDARFDESDCDEGIEAELPSNDMHQPTSRDSSLMPNTDAKPVQVPRVHPKLPDYDALTERFDALKYSKSHR